jgi:Ser/Thr protein kinase RdoA (MazF antagonist)
MRAFDEGTGDGTEVALPKGDVTEGVVRVGDTVRRPRQEQSAFVAAYLDHLEAVGFPGAPRFRGVDGRGRDVLDFVEGDVPGAPPEPWACTDEVVAGIGRLVRALHDASAGWLPPPELHWFGRDQVVPEMPPELAALPGPPELVAHCDVTPQNVVFRDGRPVALIDFDLARPTRRVADLLTTAMWWVPLQDPADRAPAHAGVDVPARLTLFLDAYGLPAAERTELLDLADPMWRRSWLLMRHNARTRGGGWARMWDEGVGDSIERRRAWFAAERAALASRP